MARTEYRYRVIIERWPKGSKDENGHSVRGWKPLPHWGINQATIDIFVDGNTQIFRWPRRVTYATRGAAEYTADLYRKYGAAAKVIRSQPIRWDEAEEVPPVDRKRKERAIQSALKILGDTA